MADVAWTAEQAGALTTTEDTLLVANAGTGKTTTVVGKVLWLLGLDVGVERDTGAPIPRCQDPCELHEIAAITFTEKAAYDLKRKLRQEITSSERGDALRWEVDRATVGTIHAFCGGLLREHALRLGVDPTFQVLDPAEAAQELEEVIRKVILEALEAEDEAVGVLFRERGLRRYRGGGLMDLVGRAMRDLRWRPEDFGRWTGEDEALSVERLREACDRWTEGDDEVAVHRCGVLLRLGRRAMARWQAFLQAENVRDFDAMILDTRRLLLAPEGRAAVDELRRRYRVVIVDEFQDTDRAQRDIVHTIGRGVPRPQLFLVGDPKQSIYRFRGADVSVWNEVERDMEEIGQVRPLTRNFRSTRAVIEYANRAGRLALETTGQALTAEAPEGRVRYSDLEPGRKDAGGGGVEWLAATGPNADDRRRAEAAAVAGRIQEMVGRLEIPDPDGGGDRPVGYRDIAVLYRTGTGMELYEEVLRTHAVPFYNAQPADLDSRQEVADLLNALRLVQNPRDDMRAFGFLRSPFVGLRDEVLARMRLTGGSGSLLAQARRWLDEGAWHAAPEHPGIVPVEKAALRRGLDAVDEARALSSRIPLDELARLLLDRTGYLGHLVILGRHEEAVAHLHGFVRHLEAHRHLLLGRFLEMWDRRDQADQGLPAAPLHSREDDVVTFSTMHRAKGLEWPIVFLVDVCGWSVGHASGELVLDRGLGPVLMPKGSERGARAGWIHDRWALEEAAEEARVLYVAVTRARERLIVVSEPDPTAAIAGYLAHGRGGDVAVRPAPRPRPVEDGRGEPTLTWLDHKEEAETPRWVAALARPDFRATTSATELMMQGQDPDRWEMRYVHGVQPPWEFAPERREGAGREGAVVSARVRGDLIHGVLERIQEAQELTRILDETIGELDNPEIETHLSSGSPYRDELEREIRRVVEGDEWHWYVEGEHHRELPFVDLGCRPWRLGSFDLYRPGAETSWIIDFKTHRVAAERAQAIASEYRVQRDVYLSAARVRGPARMRFHFTYPNEVVEG